jgi:hypothetical protein
MKASRSVVVLVMTAVTGAVSIGYCLDPGTQSRQGTAIRLTTRSTWTWLATMPSSRIMIRACW